jgi:hypothetical protein
LLGAVPFAKLQATPLALVLGAAALILIIVQSKKGQTAGRKWLAEAGMLCGGAVVAPVLILGVVAASGAFEDFWKSYILSSIKYASAEHVLSSGKLRTLPPFIKRIVYVGYILLYPPHFGTFFYSGIGSLAVLAGLRRSGKRLAAKIAWPLGAVLAYCALAIMCYFAAGKPFPHYGILLAPALALFTGLVFASLRTVESGSGGVPNSVLNQVRWKAAFTVLVIGPLVLLAPLRIYRCIASGGEGSTPWVPSIVAKVKAVTRAGDTLSVWGWMPEYYVRTGLPPATRDAVGHYVVSPGPMQGYYLERHLRDLRQSRPAVFIDAVNDGAFLCWNQWTAKQQHESFPELAKFIDDNYGLLAKIQLWPQVAVGPARIYVLKERLEQLHLQPANSNAPPVFDYPPEVRAALPAGTLDR